MINDVTYCIQQVLFIIFIWVVVNRICECFEKCSMQKSLGNAYSNMDPGFITDMIKRSKEK